ncbi:hypothetical protein CDAR_94861 [Caerostris darwini]|uniref:Uncharacterized protein n=1 Tax=Caerostris darwini TaxID=1538125 RepID=A0AAV4PK14_9ARAC|nr:hypothetical protein CDAR_94861 [Caerostris darwini]
MDAPTFPSEAGSISASRTGGSHLQTRLPAHAVCSGLMASSHSATRPFRRRVFNFFLSFSPFLLSKERMDPIVRFGIVFVRNARLGASSVLWGGGKKTILLI